MSNYIFTETIQNIKRSGWRVFAMIFMMTVTYVILGFLLVAVYTSQELATYFAQRPEVIGFFKDEITEEDILTVKNELESFEYVAEVTYVSKEEAMENFLEDNKDKQEVIEAITVNVFPAHLNVKSKSLDSIGEVAGYFESNEKISDVLALEDVLDTIKKIVFGIQVTGGTLLVIFTISTVIIIFLAVGITVYSKKNDIIVMKLVGATNSFVRMPYVLQSLIYSIVSVLIAILIMIPLVFLYYDDAIRAIAGDIYQGSMDISVFLIIVGLLFLFGSLLSLFSSYLATRRYIDI